MESATFFCDSCLQCSAADGFALGCVTAPPDAPVDIRPEPVHTSGRKPTQTIMPNDDRIELLQGTLDLLILRTLVFGPEHGQGIARAIQTASGEELLVDHGSLYPALQRLEDRGWIASDWGVSSNNRKAKFYELTAVGRKQLTAEQSKWDRMVRAIGRVLQPGEV